MSDPVSSAEIEDVLTSIRRLVSENRPLSDVANVAEVHFEGSPDVADRADGGQSPSAAPEAPLALVLTAAHRIEDADAEKPLEATDWVEDETSEDDGLLEVEGDTSAEVLHVDDLPEADMRDAPPATQSIQIVADASPLEVDADPDSEVLADVGQDEGEAFAEDLTDAAQSEVESIDEGADNPDIESEWVSDIAGAQSEALDPVSPDVFSAGEEPVDEEQPFDFKQVLEARIHHFRDAAEPAEVVQGADEIQPAKRSPAWGAAEQLDAVSDTFAQTLEGKLSKEISDSVDYEEVTELAGAVDDMSEIDEAMLREMVSDIVRRELQGALGERITRNVRKLVRREIHRALAAHDLG